MEPEDTTRSVESETIPDTVCLCGSTRFKKEFEEANRKLTLQGKIVLAPGLFGHSGDKFTDKQKELLDKLHLRKIDLASKVYIISDHTGYYGESTKREITYAEQHSKKIIYLNVHINTSVVFDRIG
jgi:dienelactone hydrolase